MTDSFFGFADAGVHSVLWNEGVERMKPIVQEDVTGCGIASVAVLAGVTYLEAKEAAAGLGIQVTDSRLWSGTVFVRTLLKHYGIVAEPHERPFRSWKTLPPLALLGIKWHRKGNHIFWHWVVFWKDSDRFVVLDPKRSLKKSCPYRFWKNETKMVHDNRP